MPGPPFADVGIALLRDAAQRGLTDVVWVTHRETFAELLGRSSKKAKNHVPYAGVAVCRYARPPSNRTAADTPGNRKKKRRKKDPAELPPQWMVVDQSW